MRCEASVTRPQRPTIFILDNSGPALGDERFDRQYQSFGEQVTLKRIEVVRNGRLFMDRPADAVARQLAQDVKAA